MILMDAHPVLVKYQREMGTKIWPNPKGGINVCLV